jgi:hypothetical protein
MIFFIKMIFFGGSNQNLWEVVLHPPHKCFFLGDQLPFYENSLKVTKSYN